MSGFMVDEQGHMLSAEHLRIAQVIHDYDPTLELVWIPPEARELNEAYPFAVKHNPPNAPSYIVMRLKETEVDHRVIARLWGSDDRNVNVLDRLEREEAARRAVELLRQEEEEAEARELATWMIKAPVGAKHNGIRLT